MIYSSLKNVGCDIVILYNQLFFWHNFLFCDNIWEEYILNIKLMFTKPVQIKIKQIPTQLLGSMASSSTYI